MMKCWDNGYSEYHNNRCIFYLYIHMYIYVHIYITVTIYIYIVTVIIVTIVTIVQPSFFSLKCILKIFLKNHPHFLYRKPYSILQLEPTIFSLSSGFTTTTS